MFSKVIMREKKKKTLADLSLRMKTSLTVYI